MNNKILMVAFDFPPCQSAGVQRTQKFCEYLPQYGWEPYVLTAKPFIYNKISGSCDIPEWLEANTSRAFGLNAVKHLSIKGKYFSFTEYPDRYSSWYWHAASLGKKLLLDKKINVIWSTFPCSTSHKIALYLKKKSGLPWVADFRDPLKGHHMENINNEAAEIIDRQTVEHADLLVFATANIAELYKRAYPEINKKKFIVVENGYNDDVFLKLADTNQKKIKTSDDIKVLYSGELYDYGRNPIELFNALHELNIAKEKGERNIKLIFRGAQNHKKYITMLKDLDLIGSVEFLPGVSYERSVSEILEADILLVMQGAIFNAQIPGKVYDYLRACKPIWALVDKEGATANLLSAVEHACVADINDADEILSCLKRLQNVTVNAEFSYKKFSRKGRAQQLATYLDGLI